MTRYVNVILATEPTWLTLCHCGPGNKDCLLTMTCSISTDEATPLCFADTTRENDPGHDKLSGPGICSRLLDGIANELFPSTSEFFSPKIQPAVSARGLTQTRKNVLQGDGQLPSTS